MQIYPRSGDHPSSSPATPATGLPTMADAGEASAPESNSYEGDAESCAAARANGDGERKEESVKLFVGQVPRHMTEELLVSLFREAALVDEVNLIRDKATKQSRGCCFVICPTREEADKAISAYHNKRTLQGAFSPLQVKYADGELERLEHKLFIGMLPKNVTDAEVSDLFSKYGHIRDMQILRGSQHTNKAGCAFVKYETKEQAVAAIEALNAKHRMEGSTVPLVVKWADTEKERQARKAQRMAQSAVAGANAMQHPSLYGGLQMGYVPHYNGYGYQPSGTYGIVPYPFSSMQNQATFPNAVPPATQGASPRGAGNELSPGPDPRSFMNGPYPSIPGVPLAPPLPGLVNSRPFSKSHMNAASPNADSIPSSPAHANTGGQISGPPGANLFIYHIPQEYGDQELASAFQGFGRVLSAKVYVDKATGNSKCFGFVSYDSPVSAQAAINMMNGFQLGSKKLKVELKRDNRLSKPF